jgi:hypothetical protein
VLSTASAKLASPVLATPSRLVQQTSPAFTLRYKPLISNALLALDTCQLSDQRSKRWSTCRTGAAIAVMASTPFKAFIDD